MKNRGFTLIEIVFVLIVFGVLGIFVAGRFTIGSNMLSIIAPEVSKAQSLHTIAEAMKQKSEVNQTTEK
jgi:prepilin-type N-terminal cleavage/methylation domain-containing protein